MTQLEQQVADEPLGIGSRVSVTGPAGFHQGLGEVIRVGAETYTVRLDSGKLVCTDDKYVEHLW